MRGLYQIGIYALGLGMRIASLFHSKAQKWVRGRKNWAETLPAKSNAKWIWFHCASLGEFEQGRNLIEAIKTSYPQYKILLTFFSPSGYEIRKEYAYADYVAYLPLDTTANARTWLDHFLNRNKTDPIQVDDALSCFRPANFQANFLTSRNRGNTGFSADHNTTVTPSLELSKLVYESMDWVAIVDFFHQSKCLLYYRMNHDVESD